MGTKQSKPIEREITLPKSIKITFVGNDLNHTRHCLARFVKESNDQSIKTGTNYTTSFYGSTLNCQAVIFGDTSTKLPESTIYVLCSKDPLDLANIFKKIGSELNCMVIASANPSAYIMSHLAVNPDKEQNAYVKFVIDRYATTLDRKDERQQTSATRGYGTRS